MKQRITVSVWLQNFGILNPSGGARKRYVKRAATAELDDTTGIMTVEFDEPDPRITNPMNPGRPRKATQGKA